VVLILLGNVLLTDMKPIHASHHRKASVIENNKFA
jgi:hypothetical protein